MRRIELIADGVTASYIRDISRRTAQTRAVAGADRSKAARPCGVRSRGARRVEVAG